MIHPRPTSYTAIEGFCGAGGLSTGFKQSGLNIRLAFDLDASAVETYRKNLGDHVQQIDAKQITGAELLDLAGLRVRELDVYAGGPPCQGWSKQRRRVDPVDDWDERNELVFHHARLGAEMLPRVVVFENVPQLAEPRNAVHVERIQGILHRYRMHKQIVCASDYETPQRRRRAVIIFVREDIDGTPELVKSAVRRTVRDVISDLPEPPVDGSDHPEFAHHSRSMLNEINIQRLQMIPEGGGWVDLPDDMRLACHQRYAETGRRGGWKDVFGRMSWNEPAPTLTTGCLSISKGRFAHPSQDRGITPREAARLQGFPDDFVFAGFREHIGRQIGNAVPVPLARAIGAAIKQLLDDNRLDKSASKDHSCAVKNGDIDMSDRLSEIEQQLQALARERDAIIKSQRAEALSEARRLVSTYGLSARELGLSMSDDEPEISGKKPRAAAKIKYRDGDNVWSGRGKQPKWIKEFVSSGRDLEEIRA